MLASVDSPPLRRVQSKPSRVSVSAPALLASAGLVDCTWLDLDTLDVDKSTSDTLDVDTPTLGNLDVDTPTSGCDEDAPTSDETTVHRKRHAR